MSKIDLRGYPSEIQEEAGELCHDLDEMQRYCEKAANHSSELNGLLQQAWQEGRITKEQYKAANECLFGDLTNDVCNHVFDSEDVFIFDEE